MKIALVLLVCLFSFCKADVKSVSTDLFNIYYDDTNGLFAFSAEGEGVEYPILFGAEYSSPTPLTSFVTVYSGHSQTTYISGSNTNAQAARDNTMYLPAPTIEATNTSVKITYSVAGDFDLVVTLSIVAPNSSAADITKQIQNSVLIQADVSTTNTATYLVSYVLDVVIDNDMGPTFRTISTGSPKQRYARQYVDPDFDYFILDPNAPVHVSYSIVGTVNVPDAYLLEESNNNFTTAKVETTTTMHDLYGFMQTVQPELLVYASYAVAKELAWTRTPNGHPNYTVSEDQDLQPEHRGKYDPTAVYSDVAVVYSWSFDLTGNSATAQASFFTTTNTNYTGNAQMECRDAFLCTWDSYVHEDCFESQCLFIPSNLFCNDNDPCTIDLCDQSVESKHDPITGCLYLPINCDDEIFCTYDYCNSTSGEAVCMHTHMNDTCDDGVACTKDYCSDDSNNKKLGKCVNEPNDDYCAAAFTDPCQPYYCDQIKGCVPGTPVDCNDDILCTMDSCDSATGSCVNEPIDSFCDDDITCTVDVCDTTVGKCVQYPTNTLCDDSDDCTVDLCDINLGCLHLPIECNMSDISCTLDYCVSGYCIHVADDAQCEDSSNCTVDHCNLFLSECTNIPNNTWCDDGDFCTDDWCDVVVGCQHAPHRCDDDVPCNVDYCMDGACVFDYSAGAQVCDDGIGCTMDVCDEKLARCMNRANDSLCDDHDACTIDSCVPGKGCIHEQMYCNDEISCTIDVCIDGTCVYLNNNQSAAMCDDGVNCTTDWCDSNVGCINAINDDLCDDQVACTDDVCEGGGCSHRLNDWNCDDQLPCTTDTCTPTGCVHTGVDAVCNDNITCTQEHCDVKLGCVFTLDDNSCAPVSDECATGVCTYEGCKFTYWEMLCDDNVSCTIDSCTQNGCVHVLNNNACSDDVGCTDDVCTLQGCTHTANATYCSDGRACSVETCDELYGCIIDMELCPQDNGKESCINCASPRSRIAAADYTDGTSDFKLMTRLEPVTPFITMSPENLVQNMRITNFGPIVFGTEDYLDASPGVVIGADSGLRIVPTSEDLPLCNELARGMIVMKSSLDKHNIMRDNMYICLRDVDNYSWLKYN